ncbi:Acp3 [Symbiodinium natans]|uniref:Acp3 protein n=1 Tax=Symbiodinium natans TaxID=878477 RepID=A0A812SU75_9DINO|nr:Acp3 [Symbiodinium natans]
MSPAGRGSVRPKQPRARAQRRAALKLHRWLCIIPLAMHGEAFLPQPWLAWSGRRVSRIPCASEAGEALGANGPWPLSAADARSLEQVILVHRHGARFPTKPTGKADLAWPIRTSFWESYKGHLTPVGSKQLQEIGDVLRQRYVGRTPGTASNLFRGIAKMDGRSIAVYTSNVQRTLQSAWAFLLGFVPLAAVFFAFRSERVFADAERRTVGIPIYIEDAVDSDDKLFHEWKLDDGYEAWRAENTKQSRFLKDAAARPEYRQLLDKLYKCSREERLAPKKGIMERLIAAKDLDTQVAIEEAHNRPVLVNEDGIAIDEEDRAMLKRIGDEVKRRWYGAASGLVEESYGKKGAGYLAHKICRHMQQKAAGKSQLRFVEMSCHDTTLCALATHLGLELPTIGFGAFLLFELHSSQDGHFVKVYFNSDPASGAASYSGLRPLLLPLGEDRLVSVGRCPKGSIPLKDLCGHGDIPLIEDTFQSFLELCGVASAQPTRQAFKELFKQDHYKWISLEQWRQRYAEAFEFFDTDSDGQLSREEVLCALAEWGYSVSKATVDTLFLLVDSDPETSKLDQEGLYLTMAALVGIRGGLHGQVMSQVAD